MTFEDLLDILAEQFSCDAAELSQDTSFEDLGVDAEDLVELAWQLALNGEVTVRETEKMSGTWATPAELDAVRDRLETWSQIALDAVIHGRAR